MSLDLKLDWSSFTRRVFIQASSEKLYRLWCTQKGMESWFIESAKFFRQGEQIPRDELFKMNDTYQWKWHGWDHLHEGHIINTELNKHLIFDFGRAGKVKVSFEEGDDETQMILTQYDIPTDEDSIRNYYYGCTNGWSFWMLNLKAFVEHGIVLNNPNNPFDDPIKCELINA